MKIKWFGHSAFKITTDQGVKIIVDPYQSGAFGGALAYGKIAEEADVVLTSHDHDDHNYIEDIKGKFVHIRSAGNHEAKGVKITALPSYHDASRGAKGAITFFSSSRRTGSEWPISGTWATPSPKPEVEKLGAIDVLFLPVGGYFTIDPKEATTVAADVNAAITIPMHFKTPKCDFPITPVEEFTRGKERVRNTGAPEIDIKKGTLPKEPEILVFTYAL